MGHKVNPVLFRVLNGRSWRSNWFANKKTYADLIKNDIRIKKMVFSFFNNAGIANVSVARASDQLVITISTSRPGVVIGKDGSSIDALKEKIQQKFQIKNVALKVDEIRKPDIKPEIIAESISRQIEKRIPYRRAVKQCLQKAMDAGAKGCKIKIAGRLNGVEIARSETYIKGTIPLQTIRSNVDYTSMRASTTYGVIGVKVWVYLGDF